jgi:fucose permease
MGLLTTTYGLGQVVGPPLVALLLVVNEGRAGGFDASLQVASLALLAGTVLYCAMARAWPLAGAESPSR